MNPAMERHGGQALPSETSEYYYHGMTLRDYFAAKAMHVYMQNTNSTIDDDAKHAYAMADAMLRAREVKE